MATRKAEATNGGFKAVLATSLRDFDVTLADANSITVQAHFYDGRRGKGRPLSFVTVRPDGTHIVSHVIHGKIWRKVKESTPAERRTAFEKLCALEAHAA